MTGLGHHEEPHTTTEPSTNGSEAPRPSTDADLVRRLQADGLGAFDPFFDRFRGPIFRAAYAITGDAHIAEEILHETFTRAFRHRRTLRTDVSPLPWLQRVALNLCYDTLGRKRVRTQPLEETHSEHIHDSAAGPSERAEQVELAAIVRDSIAALPPKHRSVVALYYLQRMSLQEVADTLDIQLGTVKSRLHYALRQLRSELERDRRFGGAYLPLAEEEWEVGAG